MKSTATVYTIGHSNHELDYFLELLNTYQINCLIDVRTVAASAYNPQYNKAALQATLQAQDIVYMHFKQAFGARHDNEQLQDDSGQVDFQAVQKSQAFLEGVERVKKGLAKNYRIALMCSEGHPLECHRFSMIAVYLEQIGIEVQHILRNSNLASHQTLEADLLEKFKKKLPQPSLFEPHIDQAAQLKAAYRLHNEQIGWRKKTGY